MKPKAEKADLERRKTVFFEIGLVVALGLALAAFEWSTEPNFNFDDFTRGITVVTPDDYLPVIDDKHNPPPPPQPKTVISLSDYIKIVPDDELIRNEEIIWGGEADLNPNDFIFKTPEEPEVVDNIPYMAVEIKPTFLGKDANAFSKWVAERLIIPQDVLDNGVFGRVIATFIVDKDGSIVDIKILKGLDPLVDNELIRVLKLSPKWEPGYQTGKPIRVSYQFPLTIKNN
jgi:protein TonB